MWLDRPTIPRLLYHGFIERIREKEGQSDIGGLAQLPLDPNGPHWGASNILSLSSDIFARREDHDNGGSRASGKQGERREKTGGRKRTTGNNEDEDDCDDNDDDNDDNDDDDDEEEDEEEEEEEKRRVKKKEKTRFSVGRFAEGAPDRAPSA
ncbi:hypothetical protein K0M31_000833 [Melipona bicolor]|uniref:Uncharacterized protein n=1 Tax=Melipona bicolor TaxID=60889 RepID=A0AA40GED5_9HYME|nr:hypothetical protein K0M31_000833 [Melipona bicolor]